ncbi:MAG: hypothetical protein IT377_13520 [Polyangiaceae bacterium]|nr:hypothetical protein [Polyangiaceae bacterium]
MLSTKLFKPVFQPCAEVSVNQLGPGALAVGVWMNQALTKKAGLDDSQDGNKRKLLPYGLLAVGFGL